MQTQSNAAPRRTPKASDSKIQLVRPNDLEGEPAPKQSPSPTPEDRVAFATYRRAKLAERVQALERAAEDLQDLQNSGFGFLIEAFDAANRACTLAHETLGVAVTEAIYGLDWEDVGVPADWGDQMAQRLHNLRATFLKISYEQNSAVATLNDCLRLVDERNLQKIVDARTGPQSKAA